MMDTIGFLGCGNMGGAIARAVCKAVDPKKVFLANRTAAKAQALAEELGCNTATNAEVAGDCDLIFLAVKPQMMEALLASRSSSPGRAPQPLCAVQHGSGLSIARIQEMAGEDLSCDPHHAQHPGFGGRGYDPVLLRQCDREEEQAFLRPWPPPGGLDAVPESLIDAASCVSGCGPAWVYQFIEALADGGVACGLPRAKAQEYAAQMVWAAPSWCWRAESTPANSRTPCAAPAAAPFRACACWKSTVSAVR